MSQPPDQDQIEEGKEAEQIVQTAFAFGFEKVEEIERGPGRLAEIGISAYQDLFWELCRQGWRWQKAAFMAWRAAPRSSRKPETQAELAKLLGYKSDKIFRVWLNKPEQGPQMEAIIRQTAKTVFEAHLADVDWVTICQAKAPDSSTTQRELFYKRYDQVAGPAAGQQDDLNDLSNLSDDELDEELERLDQVAT